MSVPTRSSPDGDRRTADGDRRTADGARLREETAAELSELLTTEREALRRNVVRRGEALGRAADAARRLVDLSRAEDVVDRAPAALVAQSGFDRVLVSEVVDERLVALALGGGTAEDRTTVLRELTSSPVALHYPVLEHDIVRRPRTMLVTTTAADPRTPEPLRRVMGWSRYVVAPLMVGGRPVGLLHADATASGRALEELDRELAAHFALVLGEVLERAILRHTLALHRAELEVAASWLGDRLDRLDAGRSVTGVTDPGAGDRDLLRALTPREHEVMRLVARGATNRAIATSLAVGEATVKYHVKNILRKLGARSRADAVARYARAVQSGDGGDERWR